ncbi:hypothetical protein H5410_014308 [Solanum commersonii]|uniref:F-box protein n=1 Tax=Solanum commersonii TaxID=4109 RepID=A0A9J5ZR05_SOLCO|nr:hypothetical protein H5410_014308 [Solanum commersonii]
MKRICSTFDSIDRGLVEEIVERVASSSFKDLINLRLRFYSCKLLNDIGSQQWVYGKVSLQDIHISPFIRLNDVTNISFNTFIDKCRKGMFFRNINPDVALELIGKASKGGHAAATYAFALISLYIGSEYSQQG